MFIRTYFEICLAYENWIIKYGKIQFSYVVPNKYSLVCIAVHSNIEIHIIFISIDLDDIISRSHI